MAMDWDKLRVFHAVAEVGSLTRAGEMLHLSQSAVSRQISGLEESLKVALFHRHARGLKLTEQGEVLYQAAHEVYGKLVMAEARITDNKVRAEGSLRVTATVALGSLWLVPRIKDFISLYPDIDMSIILTDGELDLAMREADVALRLNPPTQPDLIQRRLMTLNYRAFASSEYIKNYGIPQSAEDLDNHKIIVYGDDSTLPITDLNWLLSEGTKNGKKRRPILKVNNVYSIYRAVQSGLGIGGLPDYAMVEGGNLVRVLPENNGPSTGVYFVYPEELRNSTRISVFRDYLIATLKTARVSQLID